MHSKSKKFAAVQAFVQQSAIAKNAQVAATAAAQAAAAAQAQLDTLNNQMTALVADPAHTQQQVDDLQAQIDAQQTALNNANLAAANAQAAAAAATVGTDDASLEAALAEMANKPVDPEVTAWAKAVLADKIDQQAAMTTP